MQGELEQILQNTKKGNYGGKLGIISDQIIDLKAMKGLRPALDTHGSVYACETVTAGRQVWLEKIQGSCPLGENKGLLSDFRAILKQ